MSGERFTLDTNVLFYHVDTGAGQRHERAMQIVERAVATDCWLTLQSVSEFYAAVMRKGVVAPARAAAVANDWLEAFPSAAPSASAVRAALATAADGHASYWDARLVITGDTALRLGHWFGTGPAFWMNLQSLYDVRLAEQQTGSEVASLPRRAGASSGSPQRL